MSVYAALASTPPQLKSHLFMLKISLSLSLVWFVAQWTYAGSLSYTRYAFYTKTKLLSVAMCFKTAIDTRETPIADSSTRALTRSTPPWHQLSHRPITPFLLHLATTSRWQRFAQLSYRWRWCHFAGGRWWGLFCNARQNWRRAGPSVRFFCGWPYCSGCLRRSVIV